MKIKRNEAWGRWEDRSHTLSIHPLNRFPHDPHTIYRAVTNQVLSVQFSKVDTAWGEVIHLWLRRHDEQPMIWRDAQRVKNELVGQDRVAVEVYPAQMEVVDEANMFHLWVLPASFQLPFSL